MTKAMKKGKTFTKAHKVAMKKVGNMAKKKRKGSKPKNAALYSRVKAEAKKEI